MNHNLTIYGHGNGTDLRATKDLPVMCNKCFALVPMDYAAKHLRWHIETEGRK
jgi:hypothetical protein